MSYWILIVFIWGGLAGGAITHFAVQYGLANNTVSGYNCAQIVKASTMEEAKKQVEINQVITGVRG